MAQSPPSSDGITWDPPGGGNQPAAPPAASQQPPAGAAQTGANDVIWDSPAADTQPPGHHTLKAFARGALGGVISTLDMLAKPFTLMQDADNFAIRAGASVASGKPMVAAPKELSAQEITDDLSKKLSLDAPHTSFGDKVAEFAGGMAVPMPGTGVAKGGLAAARVVDKALGTTLGQRTGSSFLQMIESSLARLPGGGAITASVKKQADRLSATSQDIASQLAGGADTSAEGAGKVVKDQMKVAARRMKNEAATQYDEVEKLIPQDTPIGVKATLAKLEQLATPNAGAQASTESLINKDFVTLLDGMKKDLANSHLSALPYGALKEIRTRLGQKIDWGPFSTNPQNGQLKELYSAITADMNNGASATSPEAARAVKEANARYAASKETQKVLKSVLNKAGGPEKVFSSLMSGTREGSTTLRLVVNAVDQPSRQILAASALQRMGHAVPSAQTGASTAFSADTFLTNWNKMAPEARDALFGSLPNEYAQSITRLSANVAALKHYTKILPNSSNTAQAQLWGGAVGTALLSVVTGNFHTAAAIGGTVAGNKILSAALTNPTTAKWLAQQTGKQVAILASKGVMGLEAGDPDSSHW